MAAGVTAGPGADGGRVAGYWAATRYRPVSYYGGNYGGGDYSAPTTAYSAPPSGPPQTGPGCLAKGYMPDGSVVFTDRCTNEGAVAPAGDSGPPQGGPQGGPPRGR